MRGADPHRAVEVIPGHRDAPVLFTCEHASNAMPEPWTWPPEDRWIVDTHWAWDLGAADVTRHLAQAMDAPAVLARFSRLLVDPNRKLEAETLFRDLADGHPVQLNAGLTDAERRQRIATLHAPYHAAIDRLLAEHSHAVILAMHSFTPVYEGGEPRPMEIGVLFDRDTRLAHEVAGSLERDGWRVALNEPYSGANGMMYSAERHAVKHRRRALELELRQDVATDPDRQLHLVRSIRHALEHAGLTPRHPG